MKDGKDMGPAVVLTFGGGEPGMGERSKREDMPSGPGPAAAEAFCKAKDAKDYEGVWEAMKEMFSIMESEREREKPAEESSEGPEMMSY